MVSLRNLLSFWRASISKSTRCVGGGARLRLGPRRHMERKVTCRIASAACRYDRSLLTSLSFSGNPSGRSTFTVPIFPGIETSSVSLSSET